MILLFLVSLPSPAIAEPLCLLHKFSNHGSLSIFSHDLKCFLTYINAHIFNSLECDMIFYSFLHPHMFSLISLNNNYSHYQVDGFSNNDNYHQPKHLLLYYFIFCLNDMFAEQSTLILYSLSSSIFSSIEVCAAIF